MVSARVRRAVIPGLSVFGIVCADVDFIPRNFSGVGNNVDFPAWGSAGTAQIRSVADADYADDAYSPPGDDRPTAREVMSDVFLSSDAAVSTKSVLFVAWGQLLTYDIALTADNSTEAFDVPCDDGNGVADVWCPEGADSDPVPFDRSNATVVDSERNPINYATAYIDLDFVYGRSEEEAASLRTSEGGTMILDGNVPVQNTDGTWLIADQRTANYPVTFALHIMFLLEHNRCCVEVAPELGYEGDEDIYQACRAWSIALFQHVTENDFLIRLLGGSVQENLGISTDIMDYSSDMSDEATGYRRSRRALTEAGQRGVETGGQDEQEASSAQGKRASPSSRRRLYSTEDYDATVNAAADVFFSTAGAAALEAGIPATLRVVSEGYVSTDDDNIELIAAREDMAGLFERNEVGDIVRGAVLAPKLELDTHYVAAVSNLSPYFKLPVDAVQRGRDHGLPTYNAAREAYNLSVATDFSDVTASSDLETLLSDAYGGDIDNLDAYTGALAEGEMIGVFGELLHEAWSEQLSRTIVGDRLYHLNERPIEDVAGTTLSAIIRRTLNVSDLPLSVFQAPGIAVCASAGACQTVSDMDIELSDSFTVSWENLSVETISMTLSAKDIGEEGMLGIGWGGLNMFDAQDYVICEVLSANEAECIDRSFVTTRAVPPPDLVDPDLDVLGVSIDGEWTSVTFVRAKAPLDEQDYDLGEDLALEADTEVIFSFREGPGVGQHPNANRGAATVNFATANVAVVCDDNDFVPLHGALMLIAWLILAPLGIYYIRYRKGQTVKWAGYEWYEMHEEIMIVAAEAVLPLGITAVFASGGNHDTEHAHWGYYMIAAVAMQLLTGWIRTKGLEAKEANFSFFHRFNKHFHIWAGRFAYLAGLVQCYRGLELVSADDNLLFSAGDGLDLQLGTFGWMKDYVFPAWFALIASAFVYLETRKQWHRYFKKGSANVCGCVELINEEFDPDGRKALDRLMPRTEDLPIYTVMEFNDKVLNGQTWVLVDGAILDVSNFAQRHPGGARLILNAVGTDVTDELLGEDLSVGHAMSFTPHKHPESAWEIARSLVVGYIEEDDDEEEEEKEENHKSANLAPDKNLKFRAAARAVMLLPTSRTPVADDPMSKKADRLNSLAAIPSAPRDVPKRDFSDIRPAFDGGGVSRGGTMLDAATTLPKASDVPERRLPCKKTLSSKKLLERFHVCPLLFRECMGPANSVGHGSSATKRPVYRYVFRCPGQAEALVQAINGVCYFNMRAQERGKGVIQRAYNAYAVRVQDGSMSGVARDGKGMSRTSSAGRTVTPATETTEGTLCIEMRIRLYPDGAMSKLLDKLADDPDNPAVQLQGPFIIRKLVPPPVHRNVVMVAAGTGINPMMQQIRDYLALPRDLNRSSRARLALVWQSACEADLYGADEITALQAKSNGLLEVTVLLSGEHRKRNVPGAAFRKARDKFMAMRSPARSSPSSSVVALPPGRPPKSNSVDGTERDSERRRPQARVEEGGIDGGLAGRRRRLQPRESGSPSRKMRRAIDLDTSDVGGGMVRGKVTREVMETVLGSALMATITAFNAGAAPSWKGSADQTRASSSRKMMSGGEAKEADGRAAGALEALCGSDTLPGRLQVVVSGPSGFVFYVETILADMGIPEEAIVLLD